MEIWCTICRGYLIQVLYCVKPCIRALYPTPRGYRVSGVAYTGYYALNSEILRFPIDENATLHAGLAETLTLNISSEEIFLFHDACWKTLKTYMHGAPIPLDRLPGAFMLNCKAGAIHRRHVDPSRQVDVAELKSPRLKTLPRISTRRKRTCIQGVLSHGPSSQESKSCGPARDMFMKFPWEICLEIAQYLPSKDFYHLRLASRYMSQVFFDQQFWKTRFAPDGDRDFLTCLAERKSAGNDWLYLYRATSKRLSYDLQDRKRIWSQCQLLRDLITMTIPPKWGRVCQLRRYKDLGIFSRVRRQERLRRQSFYIPPSLTCIVVSLVRKGQCTWVTGLKFIAGNRILSLGYIIPGSAIFPNVKGFKGFEAAVTYSGIRALKIINNEGKASSWIGEIRDAGVTKLILQHRVAGLEAFFDDYRMVNLAVEGKNGLEKVQTSNIGF